MQAAKVPHYLLFSECCSVGHGDAARGQWRFVLEAVDGTGRFEAADEERHSARDRLELLAVVRGLEALDQPSKVTLVTPSRYVSRGLRFGLHAWRESNWQWERYGKMAPVKNSDLWRRVAKALEYHDVECRTWRFDPPVGKDFQPTYLDSRRPVGRSQAASGRVESDSLAVERPSSSRPSTASRRKPLQPPEPPQPKKRLASWFERLLPDRTAPPVAAPCLKA